MPVYVHLSNLLIRKDAIEKKYKGGVPQFRIDCELDTGRFYFQEDTMLFCLVTMNYDEHDYDNLTAKGLHYDKKREFSEDFVVLSRHYGLLWEGPWLEHNKVFAWHVGSDAESVMRAEKISSLTMNEIGKRFERGENPFAAIY